MKGDIMKNVISFLIAVVAIMGLVIGSPALAEIVNGVDMVDSGNSQPASLPGNLDFEPSDLFINTLPLMLEQNPATNAYFLMGNGAVLDVWSFFVTGFSEPNALAWNCSASNCDGSVPALPAIIQFVEPVSTFSCLVGSSSGAGETGAIAALGKDFSVLDSDYVTLGASMQSLSVSSKLNIKYLYIVGPCVMVMDDLLFN